MRRNKLLAVICVIVMVAGIVLAGCTGEVTPPAQQEEEEEPPITPKTINISFATYESEIHWRTEHMYWFAGELDRRTGGRTKTTVFTGGALGGAMELPDNIVKGTVDMGWIVPSLTSGLIPAAELLATPMFVPKINDLIFIGWQLHNLGYYRLEGAKILQIASSEGGVVVLADKKVTKLEDFNGLVLSGTDIWCRSMGVLGASGVPAPPPDIYPSFERGVVDGGVMGPGLARALNIHEVAKYAIWNTFSNDTHTCIINQDKWDSLPADIQVILLELSAEANSKLVPAIYDEVEVARHALEAGGMEIYTLSPEEYARIKEAGAALPEQATADLDAKGQPGTEMYEIILEHLMGLGLATE